MSEELGESDGDGRWEPMNFYSSAEDYYQSAICIIEAQKSGRIQLHFPMLVPYYLFSHAVELALKGFLRAKGVSKKKLKNKYSHKFRKLLSRAISYGLPSEEVERDRALKWLEEYDKQSTDFRYVEGGILSLTDPGTTRSNVERILSVIRPTCENARDRIPT